MNRDFWFACEILKRRIDIIDGVDIIDRHGTHLATARKDLESRPYELHVDERGDLVPERIHEFCSAIDAVWNPHAIGM